MKTNKSLDLNAKMELNVVISIYLIEHYLCLTTNAFVTQKKNHRIFILFLLCFVYRIQQMFALKNRCSGASRGRVQIKEINQQQKERKKKEIQRESIVIFIYGLSARSAHAMDEEHNNNVIFSICCHQK